MILSLEHTTVSLNGHEVKGWSEDTDALTMPDAFEVATVRRGATGDMAAFSTGDRGGPVSIKLLPNSPSTGFFMQQLEVMRKGGTTIWSGSIYNSRLNVSATLTRGVMTAGPLWPNMGKGEVANHTFTFEFEDISVNYDAPSFATTGG